MQKKDLFYENNIFDIIFVIDTCFRSLYTHNTNPNHLKAAA